MKTSRTALLLCALGLASSPASADFVLTFDSSDFGITNTFNQITQFNFEISIAAALTPGGVYIDPALNSVNYNVNGVLPNSTPSGFTGFGLVRTISGADFYNLSPEASIEFTILPGANLSDGLQLNELAGASTIFTLNARELNQNPAATTRPS